MALQIGSIDTITATSARLVLAGGGSDPAGVSTRWEMQIATRPDFQFCVAPTWSVASGGDGTVAVPGLNAGTTYYVRARNRYSASVEEWGATNGFTTAAGAARDLAPKAVMIEPALIVTPEPLFDLSMTGPVAGFPMSNLLLDSPVAARSSGTPGNVNNVALFFRTAGVPVDVFALLQTSLPEAATIEIRSGTSLAQLTGGGSNQTTGTRQFRASPLLPGRPGYHALVRAASPMAGPWFAIVIDVAAGPGNIKHFEHLIVGRNRVTKNHTVDLTVAPQPLTSIDRRRSGIPDRVIGLPMRRVEFEIAQMTEAQFESQYQDLWQRENMPVLVAPNTKAGAFLHDRIFYGDMSGGRVAQSNIRYTRGFAVNSLI